MVLSRVVYTMALLDFQNCLIPLSGLTVPPFRPSNNPSIPRRSACRRLAVSPPGRPPSHLACSFSLLTLPASSPWLGRCPRAASCRPARSHTPARTFSLVRASCGSLTRAVLPVSSHSPHSRPDAAPRRFARARALARDISPASTRSRPPLARAVSFARAFSFARVLPLLRAVSLVRVHLHARAIWLARAHLLPELGSSLARPCWARFRAVSPVLTRLRSPACLLACWLVSLACLLAA